MAYTPPNSFTNNTPFVASAVKANDDALKIYLHEGIVGASKASKPLERVAQARAASQAQTRAFIQGGGTQTSAMGNIAATKQGIRAATAPMREESLSLADLGRTAIVPAEREATRLRDAAAAEVNRARRFLTAADEQGAVLGQMDDLGDVFDPAAINRQRGLIGGLEQRGGQAAAQSLALGTEARAAEEVAANLRAQGLKPLDISTVVGRLRASAADAEFVNPARFRVLTEFAKQIGMPLLPWQENVILESSKIKEDGSFQHKTNLIIAAHDNEVAALRHNANMEEKARKTRKELYANFPTMLKEFKGKDFTTVP